MKMVLALFPWEQFNTSVGRKIICYMHRSMFKIWYFHLFILKGEIISTGLLTKKEWKWYWQFTTHKNKIKNSLQIF
jgi:hypothetical protein